jgi:hypothetical protein
MTDPVQAMSTQPNRERGPLTFLKVLWSGSVGSDISTVYNGMCPRFMRVGVVGTLVVNFIDGTNCTIPAVCMNVAAPPFDVGTIISFTASGSTAHTILLGY